MDNHRYNWLTHNKFFNVSIERDEHKSSYRSTKEEVSNIQAMYAISENEAKKMIDADTIWVVQVYPDTAIGFSIYHSHSLDIALDKAIADYPL